MKRFGVKSFVRHSPALLSSPRVHRELCRCAGEPGVPAESSPAAPAQDSVGNGTGMYKIISDDTCFEKTAKREELAKSKCCIVWSFSSFMVE